MNFLKKIENNLVKKYCIFNKIKQTPKEIKAYSEMTNVKRKRITINKGSTTTYHRAYLMDLILKGDSELINFAYDVGLGEKNSIDIRKVDASISTLISDIILKIYEENLYDEPIKNTCLDYIDIMVKEDLYNFENKLNEKFNLFGSVR